MFRHVGLGIALLIGCGGNDGPSGTADADLGTMTDADLSCQLWRRVDVGLTEVVSDESVAMNPERTARFVVDVQHCPGDLPAMPEIGFTLENEFVMPRMSVWRSLPDCTQTVTVKRPISIRFPYAGAWKFVLPGGTQRSFTVVAAPMGACNQGGSCERDCDCPTGVCLSGLNIGGIPVTGCATPCEFDRDCNGSRCLDVVPDSISHVCSENPATECDATRPCPTGFSCAAGVCQPQFTLSAATRHDCTCDSDCDEGLHCAFHTEYGATTGRCEALCLTASDGWCQGPHVCVAGSIEPVRGVCGWIGD